MNITTLPYHHSQLEDILTAAYRIIEETQGGEATKEQHECIQSLNKNTIAIAEARDTKGSLHGLAILCRNPVGEIELGKLYVDKHLRRRGYGTQLIMNLCDYAKTHVHESLIATTNNDYDVEKAKVLSECGFIRTDRAPWDREDNSEFTVWKMPAN